MKKYEFTGETKMVNGVTLHQIRALVDFGDVLAGDIGGWIEKEENLSHDGTAWVYGNAAICGNAEVYGDAEVHGDAKVCGNAEVYGDAEVCGDAKVYGDAKVCGDAWVSSARHVLVVGPIGSRDEFTTFYRDRNNEITVKCGCFLGKIDVFLDKVADTHGNSKHATTYRAAAALAKLQIDRGETTP